LIENLSVTVITLWKNNPDIRAWYGDNVNLFFDYLSHFSNNPERLWCECFLRASITIH